MSNTIDIDLGNKDNNMDLFSFHWMALFKDGSYIKQFENNIEHLFQEVKDRFDELQFFYLYNKNNFKEKFIIDLENGFIYKNIIIQDFKENKDNKKYNIRPIYKRIHRHKITIGKITTDKEEIHYLLGFQYNDENNQNYKILFQIDSGGNFIVTGE